MKNAFWAGLFAHSSVTSIGQDILGKEEFIRRAEADWMDAAYSVPIAVAMFAFAVWLYMKPDTGKDGAK